MWPETPNPEDKPKRQDVGDETELQFSIRRSKNRKGRSKSYKKARNRGIRMPRRKSRKNAVQWRKTTELSS